MQSQKNCICRWVTVGWDEVIDNIFIFHTGTQGSWAAIQSQRIVNIKISSHVPNDDHRMVIFILASPVHPGMDGMLEHLFIINEGDIELIQTVG